MNDWMDGAALKAVVIVLAIIGGIAVLSVFSMAVMHSVMSGIGMLGRIGAC